MKEYSLSEIKDLYCKYRCTLRDSKVKVDMSCEDICPECYEYINVNYIGDITLDDMACKVCQWDSIINELNDFHKIKK